jgi:hypothetical protein
MRARIRTIKPDFFRHEKLFDAEQETGLPLRVAFAGLWTAADREGRFKWRPRELKLDCLPFDVVDFSRVLDALTTRGFIVKYELQGEEFGCIPSWHEHQVINNREADSTLPDPQNCVIKSTTSTREPRVNHATVTPLVQDQVEGKGREGKGKESPLPPKGGCRRFEEFWTAWPKNERKQDKVKCADKWRRQNLDEIADLILADIAVKRKTEKWQGGFIEAPLVYLNGRRWQDGVTPTDSGEQVMDPDSRAAVEADGVRLGIGKWNEEAELWTSYKARVRGTSNERTLV